MMKTACRYGIFLLMVMILVTSCSKKAPKQTQYIPKNASAVFSINPKQLFEKLNNNGVNLDSIMKAAVAGDTAMQWTMNDIKNSGIDMEADVYLFAQQAGSIMSGQNSVLGLVGAMRSTSDFEAFLKRKIPAIQVQKANSYSYANLEGGFVAGWNVDVALITKGTSMNMQETSSGGSFGASQKALTTYFSQKEDASIASIDAFKDASKEKADMLLFSSSNSALASMPVLGLGKASDLLKDLYSVSTINFDNGKLVMDSKAYTNEVLADTLQKYAGPKVDMDMVEHFPGAVNGFAVFSFNPQLITALLNTAGATTLINQNLQQMGLTVDDITRAFKGDFAVVFSNFGVEEKANPEYRGIKYKQPSAKLVLNAAIGDKAAYDKIMAALASQGVMVQKDGQYILREMAEGTADGFVMNTDGKNLVVASDAALLQQYKGGSGKVTLPQGVADKVKGNAVAFYADIASMLNAVPPDTTDQAMMNSAKQTFKDAIITSENISGNTIKGHLEVRMVNEKENSLASLARYFGTVANTIDKMKEARGMDAGTFSAPGSEDMDTGDAEVPKTAP